MLEAAVLSLLMARGPETLSPAALPPVKVIGEKKFDGDSLYRGRFYEPEYERVRRCIRDRESNDIYSAVSSSGKFRGAYQMSPELTVGAGWMIQKELRHHHDLPKKVATKVGRTLRELPTNKWGKFWQDMAFHLVYDHGDGAFHWKATVPGTDCGPGYH